jgi:hypothetical protein
MAAVGAGFMHPCTVTFKDEPTRRAIAGGRAAGRGPVPAHPALTFAEDGAIGSLNPVCQDEGAPEEPWIGVPPRPIPTGGCCRTTTPGGSETRAATDLRRVGDGSLTPEARSN